MTRRTIRSRRVKPVAQTRRRSSCPEGRITRERKGRRIFVPASCITDVGRPGIGPLRHGELAQFGYEHVAAMSERQRHLALAKAVKMFGSLSVWRKLNAVFVYTRHTAPASSSVFKADRDWIKKHYGF